MSPSKNNVITFRLAKNGGDKDIKKALKGYDDRTERIKELLRHGIKFEALVTLGWDQRKMEEHIPFTLPTPSKPKAMMYDGIEVRMEGVTKINGKDIRNNLLAGFE